MNAIMDSFGVDEEDGREAARLALEAGQMGGWSWDMVSGLVRGDLQMTRFFNLDFETQPWDADILFSRIYEPDVARVNQAVEKAIETDEAFEAEFRLTGFPEHPLFGTTRWVGGRGRIVERDADGAPVKMFGLNWDISDRKLQENRLTVLASEMDHRVKNAFAVIRALINLGLRSDETKADFAATLKSQVEAMATAHNVSARFARETELSDAPVPIEDILQEALSPWKKDELVTLAVTDRVQLHPGEASSVSMLIYELATNATKYSVLGANTGKLHVSASVTDTGERQLVWREIKDGPPVPKQDPAVAEAGFGEVLIIHCAKTLGAVLDRELNKNGFTLKLVMPPFDKA